MKTLAGLTVILLASSGLNCETLASFPGQQLPVISRFNPESVARGWEGALEIHGSGFDSGSYALIDGVVARTRRWTENMLEVVVQPDATGKLGDKVVKVHSGGGQVSQDAIWKVTEAGAAPVKSASAPVSISVPDSIAVGQVIELEFISSLDWCQMTLRVTEGHLVAVTKDSRAQTLLELAASKGQPVEVGYTAGSPNVLTRVKVGEGVRPR